MRRPGKAAIHRCNSRPSSPAATTRGTAPAPRHLRSRRTEDWLKVKCLNRQESSSVGCDRWSAASSAPPRLLRSRQADLRRQGGHRFRPGYRPRARRAACKIERDTPPRPVPMPTSAAPGGWNRAWWRRWLSNWTSEPVLRHPNFEGLGEDKPARSSLEDPSAQLDGCD